jgi:hypothetical protein
VRTASQGLTPVIEAAQTDLPADHEAKEQDERGVLGRQRPHWRLGNWKKVSTSSPPSWRLRTTPGQRGVHFCSKAVYAARAAAALSA